MFSVTDWKRLGMFVRIQQTIYPESFLGGFVVEKFHRKLNYKKRNVCPKNLNSLQKHFLRQINFGKTLKFCQSWKENNWARLSQMHFTSREWFFSMQFFSKKLKILFRFAAKRVWSGLSVLRILRKEWNFKVLCGRLAAKIF